MYQFQEKPYCNSGSHYIFPLNNIGLEKYNSKEGHPAAYLNRLNPTIFNQIINKSQDSTENTTTSNQRSEKKNNKNIIQQNNNTSSYQEIPRINNSNNKTKQDYNQNKAIVKDISRKSCHQQGKNSFTSKDNGNYIMPFELRLKQQKKYFNTLHKKMDFKDIFGYSQPTKNNSRKDIFECSINALKENLSVREVYDNKSCMINNNSFGTGKSINGGISIPRIKRDENKVSSNLFNSLTMKLNRSLSIPHYNVFSNNDNINVLKKNDDLKQTLDQQTNNVYLRKIKLPSLTKVISTRQVISKSIGNTKYLGPKYCPYSDTNNAHERFTRNYIGGKYNH